MIPFYHMNHSNIGNLNQYQHQPQTVRGQGLITEPGLALKLYSMSRDQHHSDEFVIDTKRFLKKEIGAGEIEPLTGMGFAILSKDMLNVARWDNKYPIVLVNQLYGFENNDIGTIAPLDIRKIGCFCIWELGIVNHERNAWIKYLKSARAEHDKRLYLGDFIEGSLEQLVEEGGQASPL